MIIIHHPHKGADYALPLEYYTQKHKEDLKTGHYEPVLDEHGLRQPRQHCRTFYINSHGQDDDPEHFARDCRQTNRRYHKNSAYGDIKNHEYILSHDASDRLHLTDADLEQEAREWAEKYASGYQVLISIHRDTDNDHIHITINSVRDCAREPQSWMKCGSDGDPLPCEICAGGKHQQSSQLRCDMNDWAAKYAKEHQLLVEDNNAKARAHTEERYSKRNAFLREAALCCAADARDAQELVQLLWDQYGITLIMRGNTISLLAPEAKKATWLRTLDLTPQDLVGHFDTSELRNAASQTPQKKAAWNAYHEISDAFWKQQKESLAACQRGIQVRFDDLNEHIANAKEIRKYNRILLSYRAGFFSRMEARSQLKKLNCSEDEIDALIAHDKDCIDRYKQRQRKLSMLTEAYKLYAAQARAALNANDWEAYDEALEWMQLTTKRLQDPNSVVTQKEIDMEKKRLTELEQRAKKKAPSKKQTPSI